MINSSGSGCGIRTALVDATSLAVSVVAVPGSSTAVLPSSTR
jgi:hypothetical protein